MHVFVHVESLIRT